MGTKEEVKWCQRKSTAGKANGEAEGERKGRARLSGQGDPTGKEGLTGTEGRLLCREMPTQP